MFLLASDYDKTLNSFDYDLKLNIMFLKKFMNSGNIFLLNTGRPYKSIKREINKFNIPYNYLSCNDGNIMFNKNNDILYNSNLSNLILNDLNNLKNKYNLKIIPITFNDSLLEFEINISSISDSFKLDLNKVLEKYNLTCQVFKNIKHFSIYIYSKEISKSTPIEYLKNKYSLDSKKIYTIGDHYNDIPMIKDYNGYAMKWAKKEVKDVAVDSCYTVASLIKKIGSR